MRVPRPRPAPLGGTQRVWMTSTSASSAGYSQGISRYSGAWYEFKIMLAHTWPSRSRTYIVPSATARSAVARVGYTPSSQCEFVPCSRSWSSSSV